MTNEALKKVKSVLGIFDISALGFLRVPFYSIEAGPILSCAWLAMNSWL